MSGTRLLNNFIELIINPLIALIFAAGFLLFLWGLVQFLRALNDDARGMRHEEGQQHMIWGILGLVIMLSVGGILAILSNTFGLGIDKGRGPTYDPNELKNAIPSAPLFR